MCFWQTFVADEEGVELVAASSRNLHLAKSAADSPTDAILVGVDVVMCILQFSTDDSPIKAAHFHKNIHARGSAYIHKEIGRNQYRLLLIRQIGIEQVTFIREFRSQQLILYASFQGEMRAEVNLSHETGIDTIATLSIETRFRKGDIPIGQRHRWTEFKHLSLATMDR